MHSKHVVILDTVALKDTVLHNFYTLKLIVFKYMYAHLDTIAGFEQMNF